MKIKITRLLQQAPSKSAKVREETLFILLVSIMTRVTVHLMMTIRATLCQLHQFALISSLMITEVKTLTNSPIKTDIAIKFKYRQPRLLHKC